MSSICTAPVYKLNQLNNIFIEMTSQNCNQRCKSCYLEFKSSKIIKDFISIDVIKKCLSDTISENIYCIYLTGGEPMLHPDFNQILRLCLKRCNVCICTNGSFLNEKKVRFLKKVEEEGQTQIFFRLSITHYNEQDNDSMKYRGNFRQTMFALKTLSKYHFNSVLSVQNYFNLDKNEILENLKMLLNKNEIINTDIQISESFSQNTEIQSVCKSEKTDCMYGRVLTNTGIYSCPFLSADYRGRVGTDFTNYSKSITAETNYCSVCSKNNDFVFTIG